MEVKGKIIQVLDPLSGTSKTGNAWKKQEYVLETLDAYPKKVMFSFFGERADQYPLALGETVIVSFDIESREFNGRWFTNINGWKAEKENATGATAGVESNAGFMPPAPADFAPSASDNDDLPF